MIIQFSVKNFRSIKDLQTISFNSTGLKSSEELESIDKNNIVTIKDQKILKTVGIYGPNASGKSNIIRAFEFFLQAIKNEPSPESQLGKLFDPFLYQENPEKTESFFQIVLLVNNTKYRYGFTVKKNTQIEKDPIPNKLDSTELIASEWLYGTKKTNLVEIFTRTDLTVENPNLKKKTAIPPLSSRHLLYITHVAAFDNSGDCAKIREYLNGWTISNFSNGEEPFRWNSIFLLEQQQQKQLFLNLLSSFNLKYDDVLIKREPNKTNSFSVSRDKIVLTKTFLDKNLISHEVSLNLKQNESAGTQKLFDLAGLLLRAFNVHVSAFIMLDEVDSNFHPALLIKLIKLFNDPKINKSNSQLLFSSHDTNLMSPTIMRRDQFYFTEKGDDNSTRLYSLSDLKGIRNDADFAKQYLAGFYGAIPVLQTFELVNEES